MRTDPRLLPLRLLLLATWSIWFPGAQTAVWLTFLAAGSHPVAGDGDTAVAQTDCPATTLLDVWGHKIQSGEQLAQPRGTGAAEEATGK